MTKDKALKLAMDAMTYHTEQTRPLKVTAVAIQACKEALAEQPTNMVTVPLDKLEDMQRRLRESPIGIDTFSDTEHKCEGCVKCDARCLSTQEPVACRFKLSDGNYSLHNDQYDFGEPLYTHPKEWQSLTHEEFVAIAKSIWGDNLGMGDGYGYTVAWASSYATIEPSSKMLLLLQAIDKALREKNG